MHKPSDSLASSTSTASGKRWQWRTDDERLVLLLRQRFDLSDHVSRLLVGRGVTEETADVFLSPSLKAMLPDPSHLKDMDAAVDRIVTAVQAGEPVGIFGDYDVDGATSSALLRRYFAMLALPTHTHIPDRYKEGYGPNLPALLGLQKQGCTLVITVDCGAVALDVMREAKAAGLEMIILDHHIGGAELPQAVAVVNPNRLDEDSPCTYLAAVGVCFMTVVAVNRKLRELGYFTESGKSEPNLMSLLDIVALGTVCDVVPLKGVNRALVQQGLKVMAQRQNTGIAALLEVAGVDEPLSAYHSGFVLGPRINAGGRVGQSALGSELLATDDADVARKISQQLDEYNVERKAIEQLVLEQAMAHAEMQVLDGAQMIMVAAEGWHEGVIGIIAGRIKDRFDRPTAVLSIDGEKAKASARSVPGVDLGAIVASAREEGMLLLGGGHAMAAGFTVLTENIKALQDYMQERMAGALELYQADRYLSIDAAISGNGVTVDLARDLQVGAPYGMGNPSPKIVLQYVYLRKLDVLKELHIRVMLQGEQGGTYVKAMAFSAMNTPLGEMLLAAASGRKLHVSGSLKLEYWQGQERLNFIIDDAAWADQ